MITMKEVKERIDLGLRSENGVIREDHAKRVLEAFHIPVITDRLALTPEEAGSAAIKTGFPVVLKGSGSHILHKTESGLVKTGLTDEQEVIENARIMADTSQNTIESFLVQPMVTGSREFVAGVYKDPLFGPVIMFGLGGIYTEALNDTVIKLAPLNDRDIENMFRELTSRKLLENFRGEKAVNKHKLKQILMGLSDLARQFPDIKEVDINPIMIDPGGNPVAVDALIITEKEEKSQKESVRINRDTLRSCYYPKSVAFIGASGTLSKWGHMLVTNILSRNYEGDVYLVNPRGGQLVGKEVYQSVSDISGDIDLAVVTIPASHVTALIPQLQEKGVKAMLLITSGFRETGEDGEHLEKTLVRKAEEAGILIFGPNTMGICNPHIDFFCCGVHVYPLPGSTSLVCQSGNMGTQLLAFAEQQDIGIRAFSGSGNEAMVTIEDYMEVFEMDELTRTVVLYIESIKDGSRFYQSARRVSQKKPVVVLKGGRTKEGGEAASSHTGAMASDYRVFEAACRQSGIIQVQQPMELLDLSAVFSSLPLPKGNRVAIMTLGGGWGVITTDLCLENGLMVPDLTDSIIERLNTILPSYWSHGNPIDIVGENDPNIPKTTVEELLKWDGCDAVIHLGIQGRKILASRMMDSVARTDPTYPPEEMRGMKQLVSDLEDDYIRHVVKLTETYEKPVLGVSLITDEHSRTLHRVDDCKYKGVFFPSPERAVKALAGMCQYQKWVKENK